MSKLIHNIYIYTMSAIVLFVTIYIGVKGYGYYSTTLEERFYHPDHNLFKPNGLLGHGLGIIGTLLILIGVVMYIVRKRNRALAKFGRLKYWLEFHIFLCSLGPVLVLYHTAFKFGGIVSIAFWSMVAVVASGVIGRFIYIQIPRSIEGRELSLGEVQAMKANVEETLKGIPNLTDEDCYKIMELTQAKERREGGSGMLKSYLEDNRAVRNLKTQLKQSGVPKAEIKKIIRLVKNEQTLNRRIERLHLMQSLFKYWHVAHLPFALIMLVIVLVHVVITVGLGYTWIF